VGGEDRRRNRHDDDVDAEQPAEGEAEAAELAEPAGLA
jgi:hypothetical protein